MCIRDSERDIPSFTGKALVKDADDAWWMPERRHLGEERRLDVLSRTQQLDRLEPTRERRVDEILTLRDEQPELVAPAALAQLADQLELLVVARTDQLAAER